MGTLTPRALELLRLVHAEPRLTRARAGALLGVTSGTVTELVGMLVGARLLDERPAGPTGGRGRPTRELLAHPDGPLVLAAVVDHESWRIAAVQLGGTVIGTSHGAHDGKEPTAALRDAAAAFDEGFPGRVRGMGLALPGLVRENHLLHAPALRWQDVDLSQVRPDGIFAAGNDATLAARGEACRGAAQGVGLHLHLHVDEGLGGAVTVNGAVLAGAHGLGGEFGHMPLGDRAIRCPCGAHGCWNTVVSGEALARSLGEDVPADALTYTRQVLDRADAGAQRAVATVAASLGRGIAGLVNALDVALVTVGGLGPRFVGHHAFGPAYTEGLMAVRRAKPAPVRSGALGEDAPWVGAAEQVWSRLWETL